MSYQTILSFIAATAVLAISPGPDNIYVLVQSISNGKKQGFATVGGLISGCLVHTTLLAFGVSAIINSKPQLLYLIKIIGACYLLFLAYKVSVLPLATSFDVNTPNKPLRRLFIQGFFMNVLNPKVTLFFLAFFPAFLFSSGISIVLQFYILGSIFMLTSFIIFSLIVLLAHPLKSYFIHNQNAGFFFKYLQIIVFIGIAIFILI